MRCIVKIGFRLRPKLDAARRPKVLKQDGGRLVVYVDAVSSVRTQETACSL